MNQPAHKTAPQNHTKHAWFAPSPFTGKDPRKGWRIPLNEIKYNEQRDALRLNPQSGGLRGARLTSPQDLLTGYGYLPQQVRQAYHGARYMDYELMTMWLSVDPMADKYPNISPYAYCAWNPTKLVDPNGKDIDVSALSEAMQKRLIKCLGYTTGLNLAVKDGLLVSNGERNDNDKFSQSARNDLLEAIGNHDKVVFVMENTDATTDNHSVDNHGNQWICLGSFHQEEYDMATNGLGMAFLHELGHAFFGDNDPPLNESTEYWMDPDKETPSFKNGPNGFGGAVRRVNRYRREMGLPQRMAYEECDISGYEGKVPFEGTFKVVNNKGRERRYHGIQFLLLR